MAHVGHVAVRFISAKMGVTNDFDLDSDLAKAFGFRRPPLPWPEFNEAAKQFFRARVARKRAERHAR